MKNNNTIEEIKAKLTGNKEQDVPYLHEELKRCQKENNFDLALKIQLLLFNYLSKEEKEKLNQDANNMLKEHKNKYDSAMEYLNFGDIDRAQKILIELFNTYERVAKINSSNFFDFKEPMEHFIHFGSFEALRKARINKVPEPVVHYAYQIASIYLEQHDVNNAILYLERALLFNPVCQYILQELVELYISIKDFDQAFKYLKQIIKNAYTKKQLAFGYKKLGTYYRHKETYDKAIVCFAVSSLYVDDVDNKIQINEITKIAGKISFTKADQLIALLKEDDINYGPSKHVITTINNFIEYAKASKDTKTLEYVGKIAYELTDENYYKELIK